MRAYERAAGSVRVGQALVRLGHASEQQVLEALEEQRRIGERLGEIFVSRGVITRRAWSEGDQAKRDRRALFAHPGRSTAKCACHRPAWRSTAGGRALLPGQGLPLVQFPVRIQPVQEPDQHQGLLAAVGALLQVAEDSRAHRHAEDGLPGLLGVRAGRAGHGFHLPYGQTLPGAVLEPGAPVGSKVVLRSVQPWAAAWRPPTARSPSSPA